MSSDNSTSLMVELWRMNVVTLRKGGSPQIKGDGDNANGIFLVAVSRLFMIGCNTRLTPTYKRFSCVYKVRVA